MTSKSIIDTRLYNHHLLGEKFKNVEDVVEYYGAVQSQEWAAAKWALSLRMDGATDVDNEKAFNEGKILRTHVMRPTWHFVSPAAIRWIQELTSERLNTQCSYMFRRENLDASVFKKTHAILEKALRDNNYLTRTQLGAMFEEHGIATQSQRLAYILIQAEYSSLICSGPRIGKQFSYALLEERVPQVKPKSHDESLASLALTYFTAHGPAQIKDFSWWCGLTIKECTEGFEMIKSKLEKIEHDGKTYWHVPQSHKSVKNPQRAFLLSIYDEYTIAYKDRSDINSNEKDIEKMIQMGNALTSVVIIDGKVEGTWKRKLGKKNVEITVTLFRTPDSDVKEAIAVAGNQYEQYIGIPVTVKI